jgi:CTP synthase (UTP-ammonia lyase)
MVRIALIGDRSGAVIAHRAIDACFQMLKSVEAVWMHTSEIGDLRDVQGIWCVPASPYADTDAALAAIRFARENRVPFLGSCGGFQHAIVEYARNVLGLRDADHAENSPMATTPVISPLECSLVEKLGAVVLSPGRIRAAYGGAEQIEEGYHCSYGFNPAYGDAFFASPELKATAHDLKGAIRGVELRDHPFFVATLFQSERRALRGELPPLVRAFVCAANS